MGGMDYIDRRFKGRLRIFGESADGKRVDLADEVNSTVVGGISREDAQNLISKCSAMMDCLRDMAVAFSKTNEGAFSDFWWGER